MFSIAVYPDVDFVAVYLYLQYPVCPLEILAASDGHLAAQTTTSFSHCSTGKAFSLSQTYRVLNFAKYGRRVRPSVLQKNSRATRM
eukprot:SAG31_NODE_1758_length_7335_cov_18.704600_8_plen_86_part_00